MKVSTTEPFQIIYSLLDHQYLGYLFESFVVQLDGKGELSYQIQNISYKNVSEFSSGLDATDFELVKLIDQMQQDVVVKKFNTRKLSTVDFFLKIYDSQKGDKVMQETIAGYLEKLKGKILEKLEGKSIFIMGSDGNPTWKKVEWEQEKAKIRFHFARNEENTHYYPSLRHKGEKLDFQYKNGTIICDEPAWLMVDGSLYHFEGEVDGKKIKPFLNKRFIVVPRKVEDQYYHKFIIPLISTYNVVAKGFEIKTETSSPQTVLTLSERSSKKVEVLSLFGDSDTEEEDTTYEDGEVSFDLSFRYGSFTFRFDSFSHSSNVSLEKKEDNYVFHKVIRELKTERDRIHQLKNLGLTLKNGHCILAKNEAFAWLQGTRKQLEEAGIQINQATTDPKRYFLGYSSLEIAIEEGRDWFDIHTKVQFGEFEIPFLKLRQYILNNKREFPLPNGEIAVIPEWWFSKYAELFSFVEHDSDLDNFRLQKHHIALVQELQKESLAETIISRRLENLRDFKEIEEYTPPLHFNGTLRPYQKAGYDWLMFLNQYRLGGCLADDMGLGKTVQTLAMLQAQKEAGVTEPSLLIMPTSLLYNWALEAEQFTPQLKVFFYTGTYRDKNTEQFNDYDLILTSYGIVRLDIDILKLHRFNYVILDESQAIKNPASHISKAVMNLNSAHRLILTGTPMENSTMDLWTQMSFVNPGLLGTQAFFKNHFQLPIEKKNDTEKTQRLFNLIKPFLLLRHKSQVATDLPEKVESVQYCTMTQEQETVYEEVKSQYRNLILQHIEDNGISKSQIFVLQGLTKLRQLANHPKMIDENYEGDSGKFDDVLHRLTTAISENHKILIFSQFVKHLELFRHYLDKHKVVYTYLDGATRDRQEAVEEFQNNDDVKVFLISLKAGGVGLNLTAADYVFILDPWWNPAIEAQAVDRAHRIGQDRTVFTYKFITKNSVEEKILALQKSKKQLAEDLISNEDGFLKSLSKEDIMALLD